MEKLDKTGAVYYNTCKIHQNNNYVGETERVLRERLYEHRIVDHKTAKRAASISYPEEKENQQDTVRNTRRSTRKRKEHDYKAMQQGTNQLLTEGNTEFSAHVASDVHTKKDLQYTVLCTEEDWFKRGVKEAIAIKKIKPTLNQDDGRYHLSAVYDKYIRTSVEMKIPDQGTKDTTDTIN